MATEAGEIIVKAGVDGGSITLLGAKTADNWRFRMATNESAFYDLLNEEDRPEEYRREDWLRESGWVDSWDAALALLDKYPWHQFYPLEVHPNFRQQVLDAVEERFNAHSLERWRWLCDGGDA
jgi:hypothetical protein